jgi:integrase
MAIKPRNGIYWLDVTINGKRIRESLKTSDPKQAQELHDIRRGELWRTGMLKTKPKRTFSEACDRWERDRAGKKSFSDDLDKIKFFKEKLGKRQLSEITADDVEDILPKDVSPATRNRYRALVRAILRRAQRIWLWIDTVPVFVTEEEPKRRVAFLTHDQATALLAALPEKYRSPVRFALLTGLRKSNVFNLRWEQVNLERGCVILEADETKPGVRFLVPLNTQAKELLGSYPEPRQGLVFGEIERISPSVWQRATKAAGAPWLRFHDLRHTWATWHAIAGTPIATLQELGGWQTIEMVRKYAHHTDEHLAAAAEKVGLP